LAVGTICQASHQTGRDIIRDETDGAVAKGEIQAMYVAASKPAHGERLGRIAARDFAIRRGVFMNPKGHIDVGGVGRILIQRGAGVPQCGGRAGEPTQVIVVRRLRSVVQQIILYFYGGVIALSALFQGGTAFYYFGRRRLIEEYVAETPAWARDIERETL
jgi:hypothetical protein